MEAAIWLCGSDLSARAAGLRVDLVEGDFEEDFAAVFPEEEAAAAFSFEGAEGVDEVVVSDEDGSAILEFSSAAASLSLGDSSSTIICQRISRRIPFTVRKSSKKVNTFFFSLIFGADLISREG
ncbi:MAG: hypothetical protein AAGF67_00670 [Verrucomicrobiota bacterium]